jgi:RNA polymerase sigma factor (sigma-70 family)
MKTQPPQLSPETILRLAQFVVWQKLAGFVRTGMVDAEDLIQEGALIGLKALERFDAEKAPGKPATWVLYKIEWGLRDHLRQAMPGTRQQQKDGTYPVFLPLDAPIHEDEGGDSHQDLLVGDVDEGCPDFVGDAVVDAALRRSALVEREIVALTAYVYDDLTQKEIGEFLGISESRVNKLISSACRKVRERNPGLRLAA